MTLIFVPTVQSTGTWFVLELFKAHPSITRVFTWTGLDTDRVNRPGNIVVQVHFGEGKDVTAELPAFTDYATVIEWIRKADKVIIPTRDPLLSLMTARSRNKDDASLDYIINGFLAMVRIARKHEVFFLPVDLYASRTIAKRREVLKGLTDFVGIPFERYLVGWAKKWQVFNTAHGQKAHYHARNIEAVREEIGQYWNRLVENELKLRPFLEGLGYRDLMWWDQKGVDNAK